MRGDAGRCGEMQGSRPPREIRQGAAQALALHVDRARVQRAARPRRGQGAAQAAASLAPARDDEEPQRLERRPLVRQRAARVVLTGEQRTEARQRPPLRR